MFRRYNCYRYCNEKEYWDRSSGEFDVTMEQLQKMHLEGALIVDIRSPQEYKEGHIEGAVSLPEYEIRRNASRLIPNKNQVIITYCGTGIRSKNAMRLLRSIGYVNVYNLHKGTENY